MSARTHTSVTSNIRNTVPKKVPGFRIQVKLASGIEVVASPRSYHAAPTRHWRPSWLPAKRVLGRGRTKLGLGFSVGMALSTGATVPAVWKVASVSFAAQQCHAATGLAFQMSHFVVRQIECGGKRWDTARHLPLHRLRPTAEHPIRMSSVPARNRQPVPSSHQDGKWNLSNSWCSPAAGA